MNENQPSEHDRQQQLAELQARLKKLTEERKAELRRSGPLPGDVIPPTAEDEAPERAVETPAPVEAVSPAAPEMETAPVTPAVEVAPEASAPQSPAPSPSAVPPADPQPSTPPPSDPLPVLETPPPLEAPADHQPVAEASTPPDSERPTWLSGTPPAEAPPVAGTRRPSAVSAARIAILAGEAKRAAQELGRQAIAKARSLTSQRPPRRPRAQPRPDVPGNEAAVADAPVNEESTEPRAKKRRYLRAAVLVGFGLIGGVAFMQFGDFELPRVLKGTLPAAETDDAGSPAVNAAGSILPAEKDADPVTGETVRSGSTVDDAIGPVETVPAKIWMAPPELDISSPDAADAMAVEVDLTLLEPAASEPIPITSSSALPSTGNPTQRPTFIPYDVPPKLENPSEIQRLLERVYPAQLRDAGIEGTVILWIFVDGQGVVQKTEVKESSGYEVMDEAALSTAEKMRFSPAMNRDKATPVWLAQPITLR
jgi:TonB family protein